jgi:hypothetical protein
MKIEDNKMIHFMTNIINNGECHVLMGSTDCDGTTGYRQWKLTHPDQLIEKVTDWFDDPEGPTWFEILDKADTIHPLYDYELSRIYPKYSLSKLGNNGHWFAEFILNNRLYQPHWTCDDYNVFIEEPINTINDDFFEDFVYSMDEKYHPIKC